MVEELTSVSWSEIEQHLSELHVISVEYNGEIIQLTTRPTATQLGIFYRLNITPPSLMFTEENKSTPVTDKKLEDDVCNVKDSEMLVDQMI